MNETHAVFEKAVPPPKKYDHLVGDFMALDQEDPLRLAVIQYARHIGNYNAHLKPMGIIAQREAVKESHAGNATSTDTLLKNSNGLVGILAFPYRDMLPHDELMIYGKQLLYEAISTFNTQQKTISFTNFTIPVIATGFEREFGPPPEEVVYPSERSPVYSMYRFAETMHKAAIVEKARATAAAKALSKTALAKAGDTSRDADAS